MPPVTFCGVFTVAKMREECGDGLCSSLAGQSHSAGPKARDDPAGHLFFFTCQTLRTVKA